MKAICIKELINIFLCVNEGEIVDYTISRGKFVVRNVAFPSARFFHHFKVTDGREKMSYSDFEYILCNYVFGMAVLFPEEYNGIRSLIIQDWNGKVIMITVNKEENVIRVSFDDTQEKYSSYEDAIDDIGRHKGG